MRRNTPIIEVPALPREDGEEKRIPAERGTCKKSIADALLLIEERREEEKKGNNHRHRAWAKTAKMEICGGMPPCT